MKKVSFAEMHCSLARTLDRIGDWWAPLIIRDVYLDVRRFDEIVEDLGISRNLLTRRLTSLVQSGVLTRVPYQTRPTRYEYHLTEAGRELMPAILALSAWGDKWAAPAEGKPLLLRHKTCGHIFRATVCCSECGEPIKLDEVEAMPGPGGAMKPGTIVVARKFQEAARRAATGPLPTPPNQQE